MRSTSKDRAEIWHFRLYVAGESPHSQAALNNIRRICNERLPGRYELKVIDLVKQPKLAAEDEIVAVPTLVRICPPPQRRLIGDLSQTERVRTCLGLRVVQEDGADENVCP